LATYPIATAIGLLSVPVFLALMLALAALYLLPTPDIQPQ
jgi:anaerobic C4-dicarboxylate transporter